MNTTRKILTVYEGYQLVQYVPSGEQRVEHAESKTCSAWLHYALVNAITAHPQIMADVACDDDLDEILCAGSTE